LQNEVSPLHFRIGRQLKQYAYAVLAAVVSLPFLYSGHDEPTRLQQAYQRGSLTLLTRNGPSSYFIGPEGKAGPEYDIAAAFAGYLGLAIKVKVAHEFGDLESLLKNRQGELIAANLPRTRAR
jgi:membrane-bound lytic murein transglycosylase F